MKEGNVIRLIHSFVVSHIAYVAAYHNWYVGEKNKINVLIRKTYKIALGLPESTSTELLTQLGIHNTLEEISEAQRISQLERLSTTTTGRHIMDKLGITYTKQHGQKMQIPNEIRDTVKVANIPRNVHPITAEAE